MQTIPFSQREIDLAIELNRKGIIWRPKSSDWFIDLNSFKVSYAGEYIQSVCLSLVTDEDGRGFSFLELLIDGEENGNRMKKSMSYEQKEKMAAMNWLPAIKDCIDIVEKSDEYSFHSLSKIDNQFKVAINRLSDNKIISITAPTEIEAFYSLILNL